MKKNIKDNARQQGPNVVSSNQKVANDDLEAMLGNNSNSAITNPSTKVVPSRSNQPEEVSTVEMPLGEMSAPNQNKLFAMIDEQISSIFHEAKIYDSVFGQIENYFDSIANIYTSRATTKGCIDFKSNDIQIALCFEAAKYVTKGVNRLLQAFKSENALRELLPILQREAKCKQKFVTRELKQVGEMVKLNRKLFFKNLEINYGYQHSIIQNSEEFRLKLEGPCLNSLNMFRDSMYHYLLLDYFNRQFKGWLNDEFRDEPIPDFAFTNRLIIYSELCGEPCQIGESEAQNKIISDSNGNISAELFKVVGFNVQNNNMIDSVVYPIVLDKQLMATFLSGETDFTLFETLEDASKNNYSSMLKHRFLNNEAFLEYKKMANEYDSVENAQLIRTSILFLNAILLSVVVGIKLFHYFDSWIWPTLITVAILYIALKRAYSVLESIESKYDDKKNAMLLFTHNLMNKLSGKGPQMKTLGGMHNNNKSTIRNATYGAFVGFILGFLIIPFPGGAILGAVIVGAVGAVYEDNDKKLVSDGSRYKEIKTGKGIFSVIIFLSLLGYLGYMIFAK